MADNEYRLKFTLSDGNEITAAGTIVVPQGEKGDKGDKGDPGEVTAAQLDAALALKLDKPSGNPGATSVVVVDSNGAVSYKAVSSFGGSNDVRTSIY